MLPAMNRRMLLALMGLVLGGTPAPADTRRDDVDVIGTLVVLGPFDLSVVRRAEVRAIMTVVVNLVVTDDVLRARIVAAVPRLRDLYFERLRRLAETVDLAGWPDVERIAALLQAATDQAYGAGTTRVLIVHAIMRRVA